MPRFYWFTSIASIVIGWIACSAYDNRHLSILDVTVITVMFGLMLLNEKKAIFEDRISRQSRRSLTALSILILCVAWIIAIGTFLGRFSK